MIVVVGVDPGKNRAGFAVVFGGALVRVEVVEAPAWDQPTALADVGAWSGAGAIVVELPQVYRPGKSRVAPADLVDVAVSAGAWARAGAARGLPVRLVEPRAWKGQLSKEQTWRRALEVLTPTEVEHVPRIAKSRGLWEGRDAACLVLWAAGRLRLR